TTVDNFSGDSIISNSNVTTKIATKGAGVQLSLAYYISGRVLLGTEATYYRTWQTQMENIDVTNNVIVPTHPDDNTSTISNTNTETKISSFSLSIPIALFLIVKF